MPMGRRVAKHGALYREGEVSDMAYVHGNLAEKQLEHAEVEQSSRRESNVRPRLRVVEGSRQATRSQAEPSLSPLAAHALKAAVVVAVCFVAICVARVAIISNTYTVLVQNRDLTSQLEEARALGSELEVQQSVYGNAARVKSIATNVYGMVPAGQVASMDVQAAQADNSGTVSQDATE